MIEVFRIEHKRKKYKKNYRGPYKGDSSIWRNRLHLKYTGHPSPLEESGDLGQLARDKKITKKYICGFKSIQQLTKWFSKHEIKKLKMIGFIIVSYNVKTTKNGKAQLMFIPKGRRKIIKNI